MLSLVMIIGHLSNKYIHWSWAPILLSVSGATSFGPEVLVSVTTTKLYQGFRGAGLAWVEDKAWVKTNS
jgi:hypothetical protein